jgi:serine/threonine protein kinase
MPTFGRYELLDKIGEGAMGVVHRARDKTLGRVVALKMLSSELDADEELHRRFKREVEAIGRLSHPNIVTVYDMGEQEGHLFMAMELLEGQDLRTIIESERQLSLADRLRIMIEISRGLGYAHSRGVIHRDIKPANLLITTRGEVKVLDFGLARVGAGGSITRRGVILGTPDYMSPEQASGREIDERSDMFSTGSVFYELLTLEKPFYGKTLHSVLYQILSHKETPMLTQNPDLPARLAVIVHSMLEKTPERRPASMEAVARSLEEVQGSLRGSGSRPGFARRRGAGPAALSDDARNRVREHQRRGRVHFDAGDFKQAVNEMRQALALDPTCEEAAELLWRSQQKVRQEADQAPNLPERVAALLGRAGVEPPTDDAHIALTELALIAPENPDVVALLRRRNRSI